MAWTEEAGWFDIAEVLQDQIGSSGYVLSCLETVAGQPWIKLLTAEGEGEIEVGATAEIKVQVNAAAARMERGNRAVIIIKSNDPAQPLVNYPVTLDLNGKPVINLPAGKVYAREGETATVQIAVGDPDGDDMTITVADAAGIAHVVSATADEFDAEASVSIDENGVINVAGATMPVTVNVELTPDYGQAGNYTLAVSVADSKAHKADSKLAYTVEKVNRAPIAADVVTITVNEGELSEVLDFNSLFTDPDGDELSFEFDFPANDFADVFTTADGAVFRGIAQGTATATVTAKDEEGLAATAQVLVTVKKPGSIDGIESDGDILVRPAENPFTTALKLQSLISGDLSLEIFDMAGMLIYSNEISVKASDIISIDLGGTPGGFYILRAVSGDITESHRLIKK